MCKPSFRHWRHTREQDRQNPCLVELAFYWDGWREEERRKHTWLRDKHVDYCKVISVIEKRNGAGRRDIGNATGRGWNFKWGHQRRPQGEGTI